MGIALRVFILALAGLGFPALMFSMLSQPWDGQAVTGFAASGSYSGFAEPIQQYQLSARNVAFSTVSEQKTLSLSVSDYAVYKYAYVSTDGKAWAPVTLSGSVLGGMWLNGSTTGQLSLTPSDFSLTQSRLSTARNFIVVYTCSRSGETWDCHSGWQIWQFTAGLQSEAPQDVQIIGVSANHSQPPNVAANSLDGVLSGASLWDAEGDGQWISYELSKGATVGYVRFAFAYDSKRRFDVLASNDSSQWVTVLSGVWSRGANPAAFERFDFPSTVSARYVRFVGHGSNNSMWNTIVEADINGFEVNLTQVPVCDSHVSSACYSGDVWWYDSCGEIEDKMAECSDANPCTADSCSAGACTHAPITSCSSGDSCCPGGCTQASDSDCGGTGGIEVIYYNGFDQDAVGGYSSAERGADWTYCQLNVDESIYQNAGDSGNPTRVYRYMFPEGTVSLDNTNGFRCYYDFAQGYDELYLSYKVKFGSGFDPVLGGKLPRIESRHEGAAGECPDGTDSFTGGMMFGNYGGSPGPKFYIYHMDQWNDSWYRDAYSYASMSDPPENCGEAMARVCELSCDWGKEDVWQDSAYEGWRNAFYSMYGRDPRDCTEFALFTRYEIHSGTFCGIYGTSFGWGATPSGQWHTITERIVANTPGQANGIAEGFLDGSMVSQVTNLRYRSVPELKIDWIDFVSFFGGSGPSAAAKQDEYIYFDDIIVYRYLPGSGQPSGTTPSPSGRVLPAVDYPATSPVRN